MAIVVKFKVSATGASSKPTNGGRGARRSWHQRMTALAMGRNWRQATPEQQKRLTTEFKTLLVRTYSGALSQYRDQTVDYKRIVVEIQSTAGAPGPSFDYKTESIVHDVTKDPVTPVQGLHIEIHDPDNNDDQVTVFRGVNGSVLGLKLASAQENSCSASNSGCTIYYPIACGRKARSSAGRAS